MGQWVSVSAAFTTETRAAVVLVALGLGVQVLTPTPHLCISCGLHIVSSML